MGWDIVAIGINHNLPLDNPIEVAHVLSNFIDNPIEIGYYIDWKYVKSRKYLHNNFRYKWSKIETI